MATTDEKKYMDRRQVAELYHVTVRTVKRWEADGKLKPVKAGQWVLYEREAVEALARAKDTRMAIEPTADAIQAVVAALMFGEDAGLAAQEYKKNGALFLGELTWAHVSPEAARLLAEAQALIPDVREGVYNDDLGGMTYDLTAI